MSEAKVTLASFFGIPKNGKDISSGLKDKVSVEGLKKALKNEAKKFRVPSGIEDKILDRVVTSLNEILDIDIPAGILGSAWSKIEEIVNHCDEQEKSPKKAFLIPLAEHEVTSQHNPNIEIQLGDGLTIGRIDFQVDLSLKVKGVILEIKEREIKRFKLGECAGSGTLSCSGIPILERTSKPLELSAWIELDRGIPVTKAK